MYLIVYLVFYYFIIFYRFTYYIYYLLLRLFNKDYSRNDIVFIYRAINKYLILNIKDALNKTNDEERSFHPFQITVLFR